MIIMYVSKYLGLHLISTRVITLLAIDCHRLRGSKMNGQCGCCPRIRSSGRRSRIANHCVSDGGCSSACGRGRSGSGCCCIKKGAIGSGRCCDNGLRCSSSRVCASLSSRIVLAIPTGVCGIWLLTGSCTIRLLSSCAGAVALLVIISLLSCWEVALIIGWGLTGFVRGVCGCLLRAVILLLSIWIAICSKGVGCRHSCRCWGGWSGWDRCGSSDTWTNL